MALKKMLDSPYFARIDFRFDGENYPEMITLGIIVMNEQTHECMFMTGGPHSKRLYRFGTGDAFAHPGRITGNYAKTSI